ncbi:(NiFe) hydrogenase maturation protein HypF [Anaeromyxobacter dehalogenans 2CP-C]|uniref:Carbamoyltransferase n=1 Tax=Anaeromyxobacter dehalogenans (strain 2CP-C) TaxID=290397 RepID=Q2IN71_ANADE|nr:(NiFe) hydrogenase maturation protein HypF [Anaeromyxobacter dehalogenans 2CP-C]
MTTQRTTDGGPDRAGEGRRIAVSGTVQGVGFRPFVYRLAHQTGVTGRVRNDAAGVTIEAFGPRAALDAFQARLVSDRPPASSIAALRAEPIPAEPAARFEIVESGGAAERRVAIPPDLATCPECLRELSDPADRRHRYPFTNCTACGPRFTIALGVPYDRPATTMAGFRMCPACAREYGDPLDRRFHAQPNACPACGPKVSLRDAAGAPLPSADPIRDCAAALRSGGIAAVKGLGGYHLACDASAPAAVRTLRERKRREEKPLAVMVADLDAARALAELSPEEAALLAAPERPIVLCRRRPDAALAPELAPGSPIVGLMLAYAPLHHLLLADAGVPLVMTSANLSDEPIAFEDEEALARLGGIADLYLVHDRPIASRCDDSVARVVAGRPMVMRRSRGFVPRPVRTARRFARPVLAAGAQLKNACCLARGEEATLGPHVGDLDGLETYEAFEAAVARLEAFLAFRPELLACDLHPLYLSTRWARERAGALSLPLVEVQHHHAHAAACMAEHGLEGPVLALCWDGTGLGADGASWGGELLLAEAARFERLATFRPVALAGGDRAIRDPWRIALAALLDAFGDDAPLDRLPLFAGVPARELEVVRRMLAAGLNAPPAHGAGRAFDAAGALALCRPSARFEGQVALALDAAAHGHEAPPYPFDLDASGPVEALDLRPLWRALAADVLAARPAGELSARFHAALAAAGAEQVRRAARRTGRLPVVLTGGCFQNARLAEAIRARLDGEFAVYQHGEVPPGDGGIALGQAVVADAVARA